MNVFIERALGSPTATGRVVGLDITRGLAILGMFTAHMWVSPGVPTPVIPALAHGRSAPLFAFVAGLTLGLIYDSAQLHLRRPAVWFRVRLAVRACYLILICAFLYPFNERILLILDNYGVWFLLCLPLVGLSVRGLLITSALLIFAGIPAFHVLQSCVLPTPVRIGLGLDDYLIPAYLTYMLVGLALWRLGLVAPPEKSLLQVRRRQKILALTGFGGAVFLYALGTLLDSWRLRYLSPAILDRNEFMDPQFNTTTFWYKTFLYIAPHSDSILETLANLSWCVGLTALILFLPPRLSRWLAPVAALGSMALSAYSAHILWHGASWETLNYAGLFPSYVIMVPVFLAAAILWRNRFRRGPLEALLHLITSHIGH